MFGRLHEGLRGQERLVFLVVWLEVELEVAWCQVPELTPSERHPYSRFIYLILL